MKQIKNWIDWITGAKSGKKQAIINESSEESFPASDPPSWAAGEHKIEKHSEGSDIVLTKEFHKSTQKILSVNEKEYHYYSLNSAEQSGLNGLSRLPFTLKILLENLLRHMDGHTVTVDDIKAIIGWLKHKASNYEITYRPARVLMQDFTGVPAIVDLAAMRAAIKKLGGNPEKINPLSPVDLVIDHSIQVDEFIVPNAFKINAEMEMKRNHERKGKVIKSQGLRHEHWI
jgi:aconitate hydratase A / 2-methylisocitrate dehydratase